MSTVRLDLAYHGAGFAGWAAQPGLRTVEGELSAALETVLREPLSLTVAGRTDAGVHARGQVASFELDGEPPEELGRSLNGITAADLAVLGAAPAPEGFDARRDATSRTYCYRVLSSPAPSPFEAGLSLWWPQRLDRQALDACAELVRGSHDFTAFTPTQTDHVRFEREIMEARWVPEQGTFGVGEVLALWIEADAFLRNMVRVLAGTMLEVAAGRREVDDFARLLEGAPREAAGETARPHGLHLAAVRY